MPSAGTNGRGIMVGQASPSSTTTSPGLWSSAQWKTKLEVVREDLSLLFPVPYPHPQCCHKEDTRTRCCTIFGVREMRSPLLTEKSTVMNVGDAKMIYAFCLCSLQPGAMRRISWDARSSFPSCLLSYFFSNIKWIFCLIFFYFYFF